MLNDYTIVSHTGTLLNNVRSLCRHCTNFCTSCPLHEWIDWMWAHGDMYRNYCCSSQLRRVVTCCSCLHNYNPSSVDCYTPAAQRQVFGVWRMNDKFTVWNQRHFSNRNVTALSRCWSFVLLADIVHCTRMRMRHTAGAASENVYWLWIFLNMLLLRRFCCGVSCGSPTIYRSSRVSFVSLGAINCYGV